jgi:hypothetical protein
MFGNPLLLADDGYQISRSVRLRSSASAYFNRTPASAGNRKTWTWSGWVKRGTLGSGTQMLYAVRNAGLTVYGYIGFSSDKLDVVFLAANYRRVTTQVFRDASAWYHIVIAVDTTQATSTDRIKVYVNGSQVTAFDTNSNGSQNADGDFNTAEVHAVGRYGSNNSDYLDGYLTEINFLDGQALTPSSFGETDAITGVWKPKKYTGTYGTNGFFLNFSDPSAATAAAIGKDYSGNGNNWTPNNISVTAGVTYDSMLDVPTVWADGGNGRGNYAVLNPVQNPPSGAVSTAYSNANLTTTLDSSVARSTIGVSSGKWYAEFVITSATLSTDTRFAIEPSDGNTFSGNAGQGRAYSANGNKVFNGSSTAYGSTWTTNDVIGCALDLDNGKVWWSKNGTWQASGDPAAGTGEAYSGLSGTHLFTIVNGNSAVSKTFNANFGQRPFAYTPPTGFKALNTQNLPTPTILNGASYMAATLWTGNGSARSITNTVNSVSFQPDLVWIKSRSIAGYYNVLTDSVRGTASQLFSNDTLAQETRTDRVTAFNADGFSLGVKNDVNDNGATFVGWQWKEGATQGFDIVTYTGNGTAGRTISHSLGVTPAMTIVKDRSNGTNGWPVWHRAYAGTQTLYLESTTALLTRDRVTAVSSTTFTVGSHTEVNNNGNTYVAYLFSEVAGFSRFGSYTGNGSSDGPFVFCNFAPAFIMLKRTDSTGNWSMYDRARSTRNPDTKVLYPNLSNAEDASTDHFDWLSNGFKMKSTNQNTNGGTFIFMAFAESPFRISLAR